MKTTSGREGRACGAPLRRWGRMLFILPKSDGDGVGASRRGARPGLRFLCSKADARHLASFGVRRRLRMRAAGPVVPARGHRLKIRHGWRNRHTSLVAPIRGHGLEWRIRNEYGCDRLQRSSL